MSRLTFGDTIRLSFKCTGQDYYVNKNPVDRIMQEIETEDKLGERVRGALVHLGGIQSEKLATADGVYLITSGPDGDTLSVFKALTAYQNKHHPVGSLDDALHNQSVVIDQLKKLGALRPNVPAFQVKYHYQQVPKSAEKVAVVFRNIGQFIDNFCQSRVKAQF